MTNEYNIAVKGFIVKNNKLLIVKRSQKDELKPGAWELPGGRLKKNEDETKGLYREIKEETNLDIEIINTIGSQSFLKNENLRITIIVFLCTPLTNNIILSNEHEDYDWINIDCAKEKIIEYFHNTIDFYNKIKERLN
jgi:8-oxo-dGTP diphosphatase